MITYGYSSQGNKLAMNDLVFNYFPAGRPMGHQPWLPSGVCRMLRILLNARCFIGVYNLARGLYCTVATMKDTEKIHRATGDGSPHLTTMKVWKSTSFDRMQAAMRTFAVDDTSAAS
jgi:hypothetical protein